MRKVYKKLTPDQIKRGVIFSSSLSKYREEEAGGTVHEIFASDDKEDAYSTRKRLLDDKFFNASSWKYNIIREGKPKTSIPRRSK